MSVLKIPCNTVSYNYTAVINQVLFCFVSVLFTYTGMSFTVACESMRT